MGPGSSAPYSVVTGDEQVNLFTWQYFVNYNLDDGWYLTSAPVITANWEADSDDTWTVPFGGGVGKIFKIGNQPLNAQASAYYNVEKPEFGLQFLFPSKFYPVGWGDDSMT